MNWIGCPSRRFVGNGVVFGSWQRRYRPGIGKADGIVVLPLAYNLQQ
jgi:hypothetical protein